MFLAHVRHYYSCSSCIFTLHPSIVRLVLSTVSTGNLFACQHCWRREVCPCSEHMRAADCGLCWAQRHSRWSKHTFFTLCLNAAQTGPADIIPLWCLWFNLTGPLFHHTQQSESTLTYRSRLMLSLLPMSPFIRSLLLPWARHHILTKPYWKNEHAKCGGLQPAAGQELAVTLKIYGAQRRVNPPWTPSTLPHSQEELLFTQ